ncbi:hypothetical protein [Estrella lausannensis]|uniref:Uncharacterized protein n=1 Tax=Estrella lausannensis TaxID=483423 RepID=A0A0H5DQM1_9BACT|nr:hypothetical protein [Estrella lausannensis]CRX37874.1 hypothetical protein ELAC_0519 [Estrella lausannensis]
MQPTQTFHSDHSKGTIVDPLLAKADEVLAISDAMFEQSQKISELQGEKKVLEAQRVKLESAATARAQRVEQLEQKKTTLESKQAERKQEIEALDAEKQAIALKRQALLAALAKKKAQQQGSNSSVTSTQ